MTYIMILIAAAAAWLFALPWYHPKILGDVRSKGMPKELTGPPGPIGAGLSYLQMVLIGIAATATGALTGDPMSFWSIMGVVALSYFVGVCGGGHMAGTPQNAYLVDAGYVSIAVLIVSAIVFYV